MAKRLDFQPRFKNVNVLSTFNVYWVSVPKVGAATVKAYNAHLVFRLIY